jgi:ParB family chromosome partitioning protein
VQRRSGLGRGLDALIPAAPGAPAEDTPLRELPIGSIVANRYQPRNAFDDELLSSLTASVRELGVLQPILVRRLDEDSFELIAGERRWRAAKRAGLTTIPALIREVDDKSSLEQALVENLHRQDLNAIEEATAYQQLLEDFSLTQEQVATRVGKSRSAVANTLRLLQLPPVVQRYVAEGRLTAGHARALLSTPDRSRQEQLADLILRDELTVRQAEDLLRDHDVAPAPVAPVAPVAPLAPAPVLPTPDPGRTREPAVLELEELLATRLETRVHVQLGAGRGRVVIEFADLDDLERLYRIITPPGTVLGRPMDEADG